MTNPRLAGRIALITGIGAGIGRACALMFARHGATVVGCDIDPATALATVELARAEGHAIDGMHALDVTCEPAVRRWVDGAARRHGRIDVLVNAAAIRPHMASAAKMDYGKAWTPTMKGEVDVVFLACQAAWPHMLASGRASIINFASVNAFRASTVFGMVAHCAGKAAVLAMTRQLAIEGAPAIRANTISPGLVVTPATTAAGAASGAGREAILTRLPMGRLGTPDDIAWAALFLASDESSWVTGANLPVDGGTTAC